MKDNDFKRKSGVEKKNSIMVINSIQFGGFTYREIKIKLIKKE